MQTIVGVNDPKAVKRWATALAIDVAKQQYFRKFVGTSENSIIQEKVELETDSGDTISFDLSMRLRERPTFGDNRVEGKEEQLKFFTDKVMIDQVRKGASGGGRMTRKRTLHDLRKIAKDRTAEYMAEWFDELKFVYLSGVLGENEDRIIEGPLADNPIQAPDADHIIYGGSATSKATITTADKMSPQLVEKVSTKAKMINAVNPDAVQLRPVKVNAGEHFVLLMSPFSAHDMRVAAGSGSWAEIQRAAAGAEGRSNPIFTGGLGMINNVVLHEHSNVRRFTDYGAGSDVHASRSLFMGRQAGVVAYGTPGKQRMSWVEKMKDADNEVAIYCGCIAGMKKTRFNNKDFGVIAVDTHTKDPNAAA